MQIAAIDNFMATPETKDLHMTRNHYLETLGSVVCDF